MRDGTDVEPEVTDIIPNDQNRNEDMAAGNERDSETECDMKIEVSAEVDPGKKQNADVDTDGENLENVSDEDDETKSMRLRFMEILHALTPTTKVSIEKRERLIKIKKEISKAEFIRANTILEKCLHGDDDICKVMDMVYAMAITIEERNGLKCKRKKTDEWKGNETKNRRIRKSEEKIKGLRQILAWTWNEIHRRENKRKAIRKEKRILQRLRNLQEQKLLKDENLIHLKKTTLDELRYRITKLKHVRIRDARIRNNRLFEQDQGKFYRRTQGTMLGKGKVPMIEKFEEFWAGIWEDNAKTPHRRWMNTVARRIREKVTNVQEFTITEEIFCEAVRKRKNWSAPGLDGIQNFWWKKLRGSWKAVVMCFKRWVEQPDTIPERVTEGRTILLPKSEDLCSERNYRPITCLNTCYKLFTSMIASYMKDHADRNSIWDRSQLGTCAGVLGTVDQLIVDNAIMDEVRNQKRNLAVAFYDYQKAYDMVRHDWMIRVYQWMGVPEKVINVISKLMDGWKTKLEVTENGQTSTSRIIHITKGFLQGDSYSPVGFCLTEVPVAVLIEDTDGYMMGKKDETRVKRTHSLFVDDLKIYQENHQKLEVVNEMIVKASMDTGACYGEKKCAEVVFRRGKMIKGEGLTVLEDRMEALDPSKHEIYKFLGCEQGDKIDVKRVMERVKKEIRKRLEHLTELNLNDQNLMKAINCRVIPVAGYVMNICQLGKGELEELDKIVKSALRSKGFHGRQSSDERLYSKRNDGGRGLKSFREVYDETKTRVACYMAMSKNEWIMSAWRNEIHKEQISLKREAENAMINVNSIVEFDEGSVIIYEERYTEWKMGWKKLKKILRDGQKRSKQQSFAEKVLQSEIPKQYVADDYE